MQRGALTFECRCEDLTRFWGLGEIGCKALGEALGGRDLNDRGCDGRQETTESIQLGILSEGNEGEGEYIIIMQARVRSVLDNYTYTQRKGKRS